MATNIGPRLLALRELYKISQRELAKRAGVPNSAISVIEQGKSTPTLTSLERVLKGFPLTIRQFLSIDLTKRSLYPFGNEAEVGIADEQHLDLQLFSTKSAAGVAITPGYSQLLVVSGRVLVHSCTESIEQGPGDRLGLDRDTAFRVEPLSDDAVWVYAALRASSYQI